MRPDGNMLSQYIFYYAVSELQSLVFKNSVRKYKVIQNKKRFDFYIEKGINFDIRIEDYIRKRLYDSIDPSIEIIFHYLDEIPRESSGKLRFFIRES